MTGGVALSLAAVPTVAGLALRGLADPKRRRAARETIAPLRWRNVALAILAVTGLFVVLTAGVVTFLIWGSAATLLGWSFTEGLSALPIAVRRRGDRLAQLVFGADLRQPFRLDPAGLIGRRYEDCREALLRRLASPRDRGIAIGILFGLAALVAALSARHLASEASEAAGKMLGLQAVAFYEGGQDVRDRLRPCLRVLDALPHATVLRDLLSDRATTIPIEDAAEGAGTDLQLCILSHRGEGATVEREAGLTRFTLAPEVVGAIHADVVRQLLFLDSMAELVSETPAARRLVCRHVFASEAEDALGFVAVLRRDRTYAKAEDLLLRLSALDRSEGIGLAASVCPS